MSEKSSIDQLLDLLLDALKEREQARSDGPPPSAEVAEPIEEADFSPITERLEPEPPAPLAMPKPEPVLVAAADQISDRIDELAVLNEPPPRVESIHLNRLMYRSIGLLALAIMLINIPFNGHGTTLARAMPDRSALVIRDGLLFKGPGDEVYVLENFEKRWITSIDAFEFYGYSWDNVHEVDQRFVDDFEDGPPVYILNRCQGSPHIYGVANGTKHWIEDVPSLESLGVPWENIMVVGCQSLRNMPDGTPYPSDAGTPPQP